MRLKNSIGGGAVGGFGLGALFGYTAAAVTVVVLPLSGAYFGATFLAGSYGLLGGVGGAFGGFVGGAVAAGIAATPVFLATLATTTVIGTAIGTAIGLASKVVSGAASLTAKALSAVMSPFKSLSLKKKTLSQAQSHVPSEQEVTSALAQRSAKPAFDDVKTNAPSAKMQSPKPAPKNAPKI